MSFFFFDIKDEAVIKFLPSIITEWNIKERLILGAVFPKTNKMLRQLFPDIPLCPDFVTVLKMLIFNCFGLSWLLPANHPFMGLHVSEITKNILSSSMLSEWKSRKFTVILFGEGINEADVQREFLQKGIDILLTDRPDVLREVLGPPKRTT